MSTKRSRIIQSIPTTLARDLKRICTNRSISDNNEKVRLVKDILEIHKIDYSELGAGTNRYAILIDGYVFKIALDKAGMNDNANEFALSQELQPFVVRTYELSDDYVISVCEYVTVISQEEFIDRKDDLREILSILAESYLLGDVGTVNKNFTNWGFRNNKELVILDFAYIFKVNGDELLCTEHQTLLEYDENFHNLYCPTCRRLSAGRKGNYSFISVRRRIAVSQEQYEQELAIESAYKLTSAKQDIKEMKGRYTGAEEASLYTTNQSGEPTKEENDMADKYRNPNKYNEEVEDFEDVEEQDDYLLALAALSAEKESISRPVKEVVEDETIRAEYPASASLPTDFESIHRNTNVDDGVVRNVNILDVEKEDDTQRTHVRVVTQRLDNDKDVAGDLVNTVIDAVAEADELIDEAKVSDNSTVLNLEEGVSEDDSEESDTTETNEDDSHEHTDNPLAEHEDEMTEEEEQEVMRRLYDTTANPEKFVDADEVVNDGILNIAKDIDKKTNEQFESALKKNSNDVVEGEVVQVENEQEGVVLAETTVVVNDSISIKNTLSVSPAHDVDEMRNSLLEGSEEEETEEERIQRLADAYTHLEDDDNNGRQRRNNDWN